METNDYCSYNLSLALKKAGFDYPCYFYYTREDAPDDHVWSTTSEEAPIDYNRSVYAGCSMPTLAQAQKWLRSRGIDIEPHMELVGAKRKYRLVLLPIGHEVSYGKLHPSYEEALEAGIEAALIIIEIDKDNRRYKK